MSKAPDHMAGINALPKWDPNNLSAGYTYDAANYDRADYAKFKAARDKASKAKVAKSQANLKEAQQKFAKEFSRAVGDKVRESYKNDANAKKGRATSRDQIRKAVKAGKTIYADVPSTCLASLSFELDSDGNGVATAEFYRGGQITYDYPMDLDEFLEWSSGSLGEYGNAYVFD